MGLSDQAEEDFQENGAIRHDSIAETFRNHRSDNAEPLTILIAGAGLGGLAAAIALRQQGHNVKIFEKSRFASESGAAISVPSNCNGVLRRMGVDVDALGAKPMNRMTEFTAQGEVIKSIDMRHMGRMFPPEWSFIHRAHLHAALKEAALMDDRPGTATLSTSCPVKSVDEQNAILHLEDGEDIQGDVVVGADGVHSLTRATIAPHLRPFSTGKSCFRFPLYRKDVLADPQVCHLAGEEGEMRLWFGDDRRIIMYPTFNNEVLNFACHYPADHSHLTASWHITTDVPALVHAYRTFNPAIVALLSKADPQTLRVWPLLDMDENPSWSKDRLALIGDAAHPFLPYQGSGAAQAIEDAAALSVVLPIGTPKEEISERLRLYDEIRHERATKIQDFTRQVGGDDFLEKKLDMQGFKQYNFGHDEFEHSKRRLEEWMCARAQQK